MRQAVLGVASLLLVALFAFGVLGAFTTPSDKRP